MTPHGPRFEALESKATPGDARPLADLNFVLALTKEDDRLHERAKRYLASADAPPFVAFPTGIELLMWCRDNDADPVHAVQAAVQSLDVERAEVLTSAARLIRDEALESPFDAVCVVLSEQAGVKLLTADRALGGRGFPVEEY